MVLFQGVKRLLSQVKIDRRGFSTITPMTD